MGEDKKMVTRRKRSPSKPRTRFVSAGGRTLVTCYIKETIADRLAYRVLYIYYTFSLIYKGYTKPYIQ